MKMAVWMEGRVTGPEEARVSVLDHGFLFGDSVYEVVRTAGREPFELRPHLDRLRRSAAQLDLSIPFSDADIEKAVLAALGERDPGDSAVRIIVTRGVGPLSLDPSSCTRPALIVIAWDVPAWPERFRKAGIHLHVATRERTSPNALEPGAKTGNYLNNMLAYVEAVRAGADEALMRSAAGVITECPTSNIFFADGDGILFTPAIECGILAGITRQRVLEHARALGVEAREGHYPLGDLLAAREAFITSTTRGAMPVRQVGGTTYESPGPVTRAVAAALDAALEAFRRDRSGRGA